MQHPLTTYREQHGLSQLKLAKVIGVTQAIVGRWEKGINKITAERAVTIEEKLGEELQAETLSFTIRRFEKLKAARQHNGNKAR